MSRRCAKRPGLSDASQVAVRVRARRQLCDEESHPVVQHTLTVVAVLLPVGLLVFVVVGCSLDVMWFFYLFSWLPDSRFLYQAALRERLSVTALHGAEHRAKTIRLVHLFVGSPRLFIDPFLQYGLVGQKNGPL